MAGNIDPIYTRKANIGITPTITAANTALDGTGTVATAFTADATNGSFVQKLRFKALGTNVATVARIFLNNGATNATATNNVLYDEVSLPATTGSSTVSTLSAEIALAIPLPAGWKVNITIGTAVAAGWVVSGVGGDY